MPMTDMNMRANTSRNYPGRTYRFYTGKTIYEFGHGLSYSTFSKFITSAPSTLLIQSNTTTTFNTHSNIQSEPISSTGQAIDISGINCQSLAFDLVVGVRNNGPIHGSHVVLAFWKPPSSQGLLGAPKLQLVGFERVEVKNRATKSLTMRLDVCKRLNLVDSEGKRKLVTGIHTILVGSPGEQQVKHHLNVRLAEKLELRESF